jgi:hypothetical protein
MDTVDTGLAGLTPTPPPAVTQEPTPSVQTEPDPARTRRVRRARIPAPAALLTDSNAKRLLSILTSAERKEYPICTGVLDYFPDALAMVAHVSYKGNQKHNPGQPLHWARGKSQDHADCVVRHYIERDRVEDDMIHLANAAWRCLADLQEYLEKKYQLDLPRGATEPGVELPRQ